MSRFLCVFFFLICISCSISSQNEIKQILEINDFKIVLFVKNVGATSDYSTNISIIDKKSKITNRDIGNIFIAKGKKQVSITLKDDNVLINHSFTDEDIFNRKSSLFGINFIYTETR